MDLPKWSLRKSNKYTDVREFVSSMEGACAVLYGNLLPACLFHIFPRYVISGMFFVKRLPLLSQQILYETFLIPRRIQRDCITAPHVFM